MRRPERSRSRLALIAVAAALTSVTAQAPASADATGAQASRTGASYGTCWIGEADFTYNADGVHQGYQSYDTDGTGYVTQGVNCNSWIDSGVLQWSGYRWRSGAWHHFGWTQPPHSFGYYDLYMNDARDVHFRVCNVKNGVVSGCGAVA
ncbi:hypothetical protein ACWEFL_07285 [Streptomyces sp. NPDC004838]